MIDRDPIRTDARREARNARLGPNPVCVLCPERRPSALTPVTRQFLQLHHVAGRANDKRLVVPLCLNCHADITEKYRAAAVPLDPPPTLLHRVLGCLRGVAAFMPDLGKACDRWADQLEQFITTLDTRFPSWRDFPESQ
jgi:hypothetical protein